MPPNSSRWRARAVARAELVAGAVVLAVPLPVREARRAARSSPIARSSGSAVATAPDRRAVGSSELLRLKRSSIFPSSWS
jgi:hypothetical protein